MACLELDQGGGNQDELARDFEVEITHLLEATQILRDDARSG